MEEMMISMLIKEACKARELAYTPYSHFQVGAALLCEDGNIFTGCNIENAGYTATNCAERTAVFKAVSTGRRKFSAIAVVGGKEGAPLEFCPPCGVCRQVLSEFCESDFPIILAMSETDYKIYTLDELLPLRFEL